MRVLLIDDHALFREGVMHVLHSMSEHPEVKEAGNGQDALNLLDLDTEFDLALLDLNLPDRSGLDMIGLLRNKAPDLAIIVLSASEDFTDAKRALDLGASGYITKSSTSQVMVNAMRLVLSGGIYLPTLLLQQWQSPPVASARPAASSHSAEADAHDPLTARQLDVLKLLAEGKSNKEIARELGMAEGTVKIHVTAIFRSLNVVNRTQAVLAAKKLGLVND